MKIGIFSECYHPTMNGVVISIDTFRQKLEEKGHQIYVFAPKSKGWEENDQYVFRFPSITLPKHKDYPIALPTLTSSLVSKIINLDLDIIHTQHLFFMGRLGLKMARKLDIPLIHTYHTLIAEYTHYVPLFSGLAKKFVINLSRDYCNRCDQIVTPSPSMKKVLLAYGIKTPIEPIPTGINLADFTHADSRPMRTKWDIPEDQKIMLYVGRLAKEKNINFLFKAFLEIIKEYPMSHLIMVGGGPEENKWRSEVKRLNLFKNITLTGFLPKNETNKVFRAADIFVFPSKTDTQGIVIVEAMAGGAVPVAIDKLGPSDIILDGQNGFLVADNLEQFKGRVLQLLKDDNLRETMSQKAKESAKQYTADKTADQLESLYAKVKDSYFAYLPFTH